LADPTAEEMKALQDCYDLHPLAVEDAINADQLPKVKLERLFAKLAEGRVSVAPRGASKTHFLATSFLNFLIVHWSPERVRIESRPAQTWPSAEGLT